MCIFTAAIAMPSSRIYWSIFFSLRLSGLSVLLIFFFYFLGFSAGLSTGTYFMDGSMGRSLPKTERKESSNFTLRPCFPVRKGIDRDNGISRIIFATVHLESSWAAHR
jgi:hypothetical protein